MIASLRSEYARIMGLSCRREIRTRCTFSSRTRKRFEYAPSLQSLGRELREDLGADARQCPLAQRRQIVLVRACARRRVQRREMHAECRQSIFEFTGQRARVTFPHKLELS